MQILKLWCTNFLTHVGQLLNRCFSKFFPEYGTYSNLPQVDGNATDENIIHEARTRSRPFMQSDRKYECTDKRNFFDQHVVKPFQAGYEDSWGRRDELIQRLLGTDHICNEFSAIESMMMTVESSAMEPEDAEVSLAHIVYDDSSEERSDSSISEISKVLQSVMATIENMQKASEFLDVADESSATLRVSEYATLTFPDEGDEQASSTIGSMEHAAEPIRGLSTEALQKKADVRQAQNLSSELFLEAIMREELSQQDVIELFNKKTEMLQNATEYSNSNMTLENESIPMKSSALLEGVTDSTPKTTERIQTPPLHEVSENSQPSQVNETEPFTSSELSEPTSESTSESSRGPDVFPQSSSSITFKGVINKYLYMPKLVAANFGIKESAHNWTVNWTHDFVTFRTCRKLKANQRINHFPGSICLSNKDLLGRNLNAMYDFFPNEYDIFPKTWFIPGDMPKIERYLRKNKRASFIAKPHNGGAGSGIKITSSLREINSRSKLVCQLYIQRPFLIDGYKFDFRVYVLVTSIEPLRIFVHKEGLARFATMKYEKPSADNSSKKFMHLTNTCVNKNNPAYIRDEAKGSTRRITDVFQWFRDNNTDVGKVQDSMDDTIVKTIIACLPTLQHCYHLGFPNHATSISCFELMGFDILLDHKLKVYLLEVNVVPSFANETETAHVACIKQEVVSDTFKILNLMEAEKSHKPKAGKRVNKINAFTVKDKLITNRRIQWENTHLGNFRKIYPPKAIRKGCYQKFMDKATSSLKLNYYLNSRDFELTAEQRKWLT